ncbi:hypothetical protein B7463_g11186, partial [Scytalidium lignicola]
MAAKEALQLIIIPHRPTPTTEEIDRDLAPAFKILQSADGLKTIWRGKRFEDRYTQVALVLWQDVASSHAFFTSDLYDSLHKVIQPALNGRKVQWAQHTLINQSTLNDHDHLQSILRSPAIEVAMTKVTEGGVSGYYRQFNKVVTGILNEEPGCDGFFISPLIENPQDQLLLISWKTVDAHHEEFEKKPGFRACIDALFDYYREFVVPWHIVELKQFFTN